MRPARASPTLPHQNKDAAVKAAGTRRFLDFQGFQKNVWNGCTGARVRITFSYIRSEGFNIAVEINYIKME